MRRFLARSPLVWLTALAASTISCNDSPTGPAASAPTASITFGDDVFTRGSIVRARVGVAPGFALVSGSVRWSAVSGTATFTPVAAGTDSVDVAFGSSGPVQLQATYRVRGGGVGSSFGLGTPTRRSGDGLDLSASATVTVGSPVLTYTVEPPASNSAGVSFGTVRVEVKDSRGRTLTGSNDSITIVLDPTSGTSGATLIGTAATRAANGIANYPGLTIQKAGAGYRLIASSPTITVRDTAVTAIVAAAPSAAQSTITVADTVRTVGQTTTVTVTLKDQYGNPVLTATPASFTPSASAGSLGSFSCTNGVCTATYTAPSVPGTPTIGATIGATQVSGGPVPVRVTSGAAARLVITGDSTQAAGSSQNITITARDAQGNVATGYTGVKSLTFSGANNAPIGTVPTIAATNLGTAVGVTFTNGVATLVATVLYKVEVAVIATTDGTIAAAGADRLSVRVFNAATDAGQSTLAVTDSVRNGGDSTTVTVTLKDAYGNPVLNATAASFTPSATAGTLRTFSCTSGVCTAQYIAPATVATHSISAVVGSTAIGGSPKTVRVPDTTPPAITGPSGSAGDTATVKSILENTTAVHTFTANEPVTWSLGGGLDTAKFAIDPTTGALTFKVAPDFENPTDLGATAGNNTYVVVVKATDASGNVSVQTVTITVTNVIEAIRLVITGDSTQAAGSSQNITIAARDASGNIDTTYTGVKSLTFSGANNAPIGTVPTIGGATIGTPVNVTFVNGVATLVATTLYKVETATLATTDGTLSATGTDRLNVRVFAAAASALRSTITVASSAIAQNDSTTVTVTLRDAYGNPITNATAASFTPSTDIGTLRSFSCTNGVCTAQYVGTTTGTATIDAKIGGTSITGGPLSVNVIGAGLYLSPSAQPTVAVDEVTERIIFYVKSGSSRTAVSQLTTFALTSNGGGTFYSDPNGTTVLTSATVAAAADSFVVYYRQTNALRTGLTDGLFATQTAGDAVATGAANIGITATAAQSARFAGTACTATTGNSTSNTLTASGGCSATAGQLLIMVFGHDTDNTNVLPAYSAPAGWTLLRETAAGTVGTANQLNIRTYYRIASTTGDVTPTFSTAQSTTKTRSTYAILKFDGPNAITPIDIDGVSSGAAPAAGSIGLPSESASLNQASLLAFAVQNIGSNGYVAPAGLTTVAQAGNGGQAITMILFTKDRLFSGPTPNYSVTTTQTARAFVGAQIILNPQ